MMRKLFFFTAFLSLLFVGIIQIYWKPVLYALIIVIPYVLVGFYDAFNKSHNLLRNYPVLGHIRYMLEHIRPEIQQYFIHSNHSGRPYNREMRTVIYQRAKEIRDTLPFGTEQNITEPGYEYANHSLAVKHVPFETGRVIVGQNNCSQPYSASRMNISAMSYGAISWNAVLALNKGAKTGEFAHNTGEGGLSDHHLKYGGDLIWQIGSAYFGCRTLDGKFCPIKFKEKSGFDSVKMIEIKLSQGAKPSHGGILPASKISPEIAKIRGIETDKPCVSPPTHSSFSNPTELLQFVGQLRELSGGKPIGFKLCIGHKKEFLGICKAMLTTKSYPDFITIDGAEGGTGAAPLEFSNHLGMPVNEAIIFVQNCLVGMNIRDKIKIIASGKVVDGFDIVTKIALGADMCNNARGMMFALGCVQSLRCDKNTCPTGITTQDPSRVQALVVEDKFQRVAHYHRHTMESFLDLTGAIGVDHPDKLRPHHISKRTSEFASRNYAELYTFLEPGDLLGDTIHSDFQEDWQAASAEAF